MLHNLVFDLAQIPGPSGHEGRVAERMKREFTPVVDEVEIDGMHNVIARIGEGRRVILVTAHIDEVSMVVERVMDGMIWFKIVGWIDEGILDGVPVTILADGGDVQGVIRSTSAHLKQWIRPSPPWIDVGGRTEGIMPGDPIVYAANGRWLNDDIIASKALDDRAGCAALVEVARQLAADRPGATVYLVGAAQEEVLCRGIRHVVPRLKPDCAIAIDNVYGSDPSLPPSKTHPLGDGPIVRAFEMSRVHGTIGFMSRRLVRTLVDAARDTGVPAAVDVAETFTDGTGILSVAPDIEACTINIPRRYSHSPFEVADIRDVARCADIVARAVLMLSRE